MPLVCPWVYHGHPMGIVVYCDLCLTVDILKAIQLQSGLKLVCALCGCGDFVSRYFTSFESESVLLILCVIAFIVVSVIVILFLCDTWCFLVTMLISVSVPTPTVSVISQQCLRRIRLNTTFTRRSLGIEALQVFNALGIVRRSDFCIYRDAGVKRPTPRGVRSGKAAKAEKKFVPLALVNARSLIKLTNVISHHFVSHNLDLLAVTESWLTTECGDEDY